MHYSDPPRLPTSKTTEIRRNHLHLNADIPPVRSYAIKGGKRIDKELFAWDVDAEVYTDGTANLVIHPEREVAVAAAVQLDKADGTHCTAVIILQPCFPQNAPVAAQV